jgi:hypothetical protein
MNDPQITPGPLDVLADQIMAGRNFQPSDPDLFPGDDPAASVRKAAERAVRRHLDTIPTRLRGALLPPIIPSDHPGQLKPEQQPDVLRTWLDDPDALTLLLVGEFGVGKTYAAAGVANEFAARAFRRGTRGQLPVGWWTVAGLLDDLRPSNPDAEAVWYRAKTVPLAVLDDLALTRPTEWAVERVWMLVNARVSAGLRQVVTMSAEWAPLVQTWGGGTMDRLREGAYSVVITGRSRRLPLAPNGGAR